MRLFDLETSPWLRWCTYIWLWAITLIYILSLLQNNVDAFKAGMSMLGWFRAFSDLLLAAVSIGMSAGITKALHKTAKA